MDNSKPLSFLAPQHLKELMQNYLEVLRSHKEYVDSLNVYPVPDGDTGTNMFLTMESVVKAIQEIQEPDNLEIICKAAQKGAVMGARGNSGVILSQIIKGMTQEFAGQGPELGVQALASAANAASLAAYSAVSEPVEGTILTVAREIARGADTALDNGTDLKDLISAMLQAGKDSLERTPQQLEVLAKAGVVDAGGAGLILLFEALGCVVNDSPLPESPEIAVLSSGLSGGSHEPKDLDLDLGPRYEVMFLLESEEKRIPEFRGRWEEIGDSIVISGAEGIWNCHIHTNQIGATIEAGIAAGLPSDIRVTDLHEQVAHSDRNLFEEKPDDSHDTPLFVLNPDLPNDVKTQILVAGDGQGIAQLFESLGVKAMVVGGQTRNPSTQSFLEALEHIEAPEAVILPNNPNICAVAKTASLESEMPVSVVETKSIPEGLAALLAYDPLAAALENSKNMEAVRECVVSGEVTQAVRDSKDMGVKTGDFLGLDRKEILSVAESAVTATCGLLEKLITKEHEILTLVQGDPATDAETDAVLDYLKTHFEELEVEVLMGGQRLYFYYIGLE